MLGLVLVVAWVIAWGGDVMMMWGGGGGGNFDLFLFIFYKY